MARFSPEINREQAQTASGRAGRGTSGSSELASIIDQSANDRPTFSEFLRRLESRGVRPMPSVNARGLNGMSYQFRGEVLRGSDIGRAYTAHGLQTRKGVQYLSERDGAAIRYALEKPGTEPSRTSRIRDQQSKLSADQLATLAEVGRFRTISVHDLIEHRYEGAYNPFSQDIRVLREAGLIERRTAEHAKSGTTYEVIVLTRKGRRAAALAAKRAGSDQQFYSGLVKSGEIRHDIGIYRMYQQERAEIESGGGRITRVAMDFEIKKQLMSELNRRGEDAGDLARKAEIAARHDIHIVNGRFVIPDLRVEYETREGDAKRVDLELATSDYKPAQIAAKRAAGLKIYGPDSWSGGTPRQPEYAADFVSI